MIRFCRTLGVLAWIEAMTQKHIESGLVAGAVMLIARRGKIAWYRTMGFRDRAAKDPMQDDSIFRDQADCSVAAMMLVNAAYIEARIGNHDFSNEELVSKLSKLPLRFSPGANDGDRVMVRNQFRTMVQSAIIN